MTESIQNVFPMVGGEIGWAVIVDGGPGQRCEMCAGVENVLVDDLESEVLISGIFCPRAGEMLDCMGLDLRLQTDKALEVRSGVFVVVRG